MLNQLTASESGVSHIRGIIAVEDPVKQLTDKKKVEKYYMNIPFIAFGDNAKEVARRVSVGSKVVFQGKWVHKLKQDNRGAWIPYDNCVITNLALVANGDGTLDDNGQVYDVEDSPEEETIDII